jgi:hypothetical protein
MATAVRQYFTMVPFWVFVTEEAQKSFEAW